MVAPPYPDGFFCRNGIFDGGGYHNGDVWTWFSNKYPIALYRLGYPALAQRMLCAQAEVAGRDGGFAEYYEDDAVGSRKGAFHYAGASSSYIQALVEGLFGIRYDAPARMLCIEPSLEGSGEIACRIGEHPLRVRVGAPAAIGPRTLRIDTPLRCAARVRMLLPAAWPAAQVQLGTTPLRSRVHRIGERRYVTFGLPATQASAAVTISRRE
jgi:hypothetical protein